MRGVSGIFYCPRDRVGSRLTIYRQALCLPRAWKGLRLGCEVWSVWDFLLSERRSWVPPYNTPTGSVSPSRLERAEARIIQPDDVDLYTLYTPRPDDVDLYTLYTPRPDDVDLYTLYTPRPDDVDLYTLYTPRPDDVDLYTLYTPRPDDVDLYTLYTPRPDDVDLYTLYTPRPDDVDLYTLYTPRPDDVDLYTMYTLCLLKLWDRVTVPRRWRAVKLLPVWRFWFPVWPEGGDNHTRSGT
ncbi:hypothetical protein RRG08_013534 [Elysia crispata]|uniref:Uncharacterized protein n=1 Tax=Elysia crispata TaxID=231223 RepID=A0AAE1CQR0_9GAST|nr:hypothetical protein RRG08_013534 [Elysia crispata]